MTTKLIDNYVHRVDMNEKFLNVKGHHYFRYDHYLLSDVIFNG